MTGAVHMLFLLAAPALIQWLSARHQPFRFMGATITCFLAGMLYSAALTPVHWEHSALTRQIYEPLVPLGIAVMLFSTDIRRWLKVSPKIAGAYLLGAFSVMAMAVLAFLLLKDKAGSPALFSAMLTASYVGGTANMSAVQLAFGIDEELFGQAFLCDVAASSVYLIVVMVFGRSLLSLFLRPYKSSGNATEEVALHSRFRELPFLKRSRNVVIGLLCAALVVAVSIGSGIALYGDMKSIDMAYLMVMVTALSVTLSFLPKLRNMPGNYETGDYLFCVFFLALGSLTDFNELIAINGYYLLFTVIILFGSFTLHIILARIFRIDRDTLIVTSAAGIMSPPFIPAITSAIRNKELLVPGIAVGILGLAAGNLAGIFIGKLLLQW